MNPKFRYYQQESDEAIYNELQTNNKCLVKMFCGTGKSRLMRYCKIAQGKKLVVYVVPSLSLLEQFYTDYLQDFPLVQRISCEQESTTDATEIIEFLKMPANKIICITYQSFETLVHLLGDTKIDVCIFDEAHHVVGKTYQTLIFDSNVCEKQIFFTATPKNANGVIMYDKDNLDAGMCGNLVYDYSYFKGVLEGYLNPFEIRIDFYTENTNTSVYEAMARAILASGNSRVLTFHADVNGDRDTSVLHFVDEVVFKRAFNKVMETEFPEKVGVYKKIQMIGLSAEMNMKIRKQILANFDATPDDEIMVISSCQTIGEGIDTKSANMCVFVDPKSSIVGITQNIGRIVRKIFGQDKPNSTILIPCWVDKDKYLGCDGDKDKCDEVIREDMNKEGNFNGILNVMSALKQEAEDLFDACLNYPSVYSPQEIEGNLLAQGYQLEEPIGDGSLVENLEHMLDTEIDLDEETDEELLTRTAEENNVVIEVHSNSLETPIEYYGQDEGKEVIRIFKSEDEETEDIMYQPIVKKDGTKRNTNDSIKPLRRENRFNVKVHTNPDVKVLWNLKDGFDLSKDICSCIIDCEVIKYDPIEIAQGIVERAKDREKNGGNLLPRQIYKPITSNLKQERKDAIKLSRWKLAIKNLGTEKITDIVKDYLDNELPNWSDNIDLDKQSIINAQCLVERAKEREKNGGNLFPRCIRRKIDRNALILEQEYKDANKLSEWKNTLRLNYKGSSRKCPDNVLNYLNINLPGWNIFQEDNNIQNAIDIVNRAEIRKQNGGELMPKNIRKSNPNCEEKQEQYDARRLCQLKSSILEKNTRKCSDKIRDYLDINLPGWRNEINFDKNALERAKEIVNNSNLRASTGLSLLPKKYNHIDKEKLTSIQKIERSDAIKLGDWKKSLKGSKYIRCSNEVRDYLDEYLPGWRPIGITSSTEESSTKERPEEIIVKPKQKKTAKLTKITQSPTKKLETKEDIQIRTKPLITQFHNKFCKMRSDNLAQHFQQNPSDFAEYHRVRDECFQTFEPEDIPCNRVIAELTKFKTKKTKHVIDMGCGTAKIAEHFKEDPRFKFTNYDHVAINDTVQVCDISKMPLEDDSVDICIMSLALWGSNCEEYIQEALRVLDSQGTLYIIDSTKRWSEEGCQDAEKLKQMLAINGFRIIDATIDKWCYFKCTK